MPPAFGLELRQPPKWPILSPGQSGLGKSTLINTLFKSKISRKSVQQPPSEERIPKTIDIKSITHGEHGGPVRAELGGRGGTAGHGNSGLGCLP